MPRTARKHFSREFKLAALSRVQDGVRSMSDVARELGVHPGTLRHWKKQLGAAGRVADPTSSPSVHGADGASADGRGARGEESLEAEVLRLRREVAKLRQERDILKKAAAFFARDVP
jgi:transposase